jgi:hypothetical protein
MYAARISANENSASQTNYAAAYDEMTSIQDYQGAAHIAKLL